MKEIDLDQEIFYNLRILFDFDKKDSGLVSSLNKYLTINFINQLNKIININRDVLYVKDIAYIKRPVIIEIKNHKNIVLNQSRGFLINYKSLVTVDDQERLFKKMHILLNNKINNPKAPKYIKMITEYQIYMSFDTKLLEIRG